MRINGLLATTLSLLFAGGGASAQGLNSLKDIEVKPAGAGAQVVVTGTRAPTFTVFRLGSPDRLVVDLSGADATVVKGHHEGQGPVRGVVASQFSDERSSVGRLVVSLDGAQGYDVRADGNRVVISVEGQGASGEAKSAEALPQAPAPSTFANVTAPAKVEPAAEAPAARDGRENVVQATVDEKVVANPAKRITELRLTSDGLRIRGDGDVARYELIELADPPRLAVDLYGVSMGTRAPKGGNAQVKAVRAGPHADKVRLVLDLNGSSSGWQAKRVKGGIDLTGPVATASAATASASAPAAKGDEAAEALVEIDGKRVPLETEPLRVENPPEQPAKSPVPPAKLAEIRDLLFTEDEKGGRIELKLSSDLAFKVDRPDAKSAVLTLESAKLPKRLERSLDTSELETPVKTISTFSVPGGQNRVRIVVAASEPLDETLVKTKTGLAWRLTAKGVKTEEVAVSQRSAGFSGEAAAFAEEGAPRQSRYRGKRVSFEFKDIDIHNLMRIIAEVSKKNIVVADDVKGTVTIRLRNVPWDQALDLILRSKQLGREDLGGGNIIRVAPLATLEQEAKLRNERRASLEQQKPIEVRLIPVNYATAEEMSARVKEVLTARGGVTTDVRTNVLIVRDVAEGVQRAQALVRNLDTQTPQVLIESRIVEASTNFTRQLGIQWGGHAQAATATGNPTGLIFPYNARVAGGSTAEGTAGTSGTPSFAVNLPAAVGTGSGGALGFIFGSAGGAAALNLRLSALENQGTVKTISAPKVTTLDNNTARISQGVSIPFSQVSASGVNTTFIEARLSLEVTPHITADGSVLMAIKAENNQPDPSNTGANGQPAIQRKEANTQVLVKDGDTTVIGGIYVRRGSTQENGIPFFSKIPVLGYFFRNTTETDTRQELLIFITPRIINRQQMSQTL